MPHQCTACGYTFADGSKEMLGGCPKCGGNKFQFQPDGEGFDDPEESDSPPESADPGGAASTVGRAATKVRDFVSGEETPDERDDSDTDVSGGSPDGDQTDSPSPEEPTDTTPPSASAAESTETATTASSDDSTRNEGDSTPASGAGDDTVPSADAPWPDSSDAADPIRRGGLNEDGSAIADDESRADDAREDSSVPPSATVDEPAETTDGPTVDDSDVDGQPEETDTDADIIDADATRASDNEDRAQASARSDIVSDDELPDAGGADEPADAGGATDADATAGEETDGLVDSDDRPRPSDGRVVSEPSEDETDMSELREQLNDQFESIKIVEPGQYELNLMELYDRDEYIIALRENGRYVIQMPEEWLGDRDIDE